MTEAITKTLTGIKGGLYTKAIFDKKAIAEKATFLGLQYTRKKNIEREKEKYKALQ
jgi:hypothetical protein